MKKQTRHKYKLLLKFLPLSLGIATVILYTSYSTLKDKTGGLKFSLPFKTIYDYNDILITYVADGDTVKLEDGSWVRFIGIDAPEYHESEKLLRDARRANKNIADIKKLGRKSYVFTKKLLANKRVRLEFDIEKRDKYNRLLAYIFLKDGTFVNAKIIEEGYAQTMNIAPDLKYSDLLKRLQIKAKAEKRGLWGAGY